MNEPSFTGSDRKILYLWLLVMMGWHTILFEIYFLITHEKSVWQALMIFFPAASIELQNTR
jgi:hypothetical protein